ncbi:uncharacterized protein LY89DRAFT_80168 [Mollisia scopiformis]|uniref:Uncharacterized protein n=1 Tax=Mollisia scopiformis TaxID=149040 RepID=A0A194X848_MOLSC|nr:uncharacterized protein LY89DRAFT_80168 [Mollisia scopiformis]KUJ16338.1 hypothetical protein LY89DRAFT_80168 [Mollisia scopiformis]
MHRIGTRQTGRTSCFFFIHRDRLGLPAKHRPASWEVITTHYRHSGNSCRDKPKAGRLVTCSELRR